MAGSVRRGSKGLLRDINNSRVLQIIQSQAPISRAAIAKLAELPPPTVTSIVADFLRAGLVLETDLVLDHGHGPASLGRRPIMLTLNPHAAYAAGVKLRPDGFALTLTDLNGTPVATDAQPLPSLDPDEVFPAIATSVTGALASASVDRSRVLGIGIGLPGLIDHRHGICRYSSLLGWNGVDVRSALGALVRLPVYVDNDVNMLTAAELAYGDGRRAADFLTVTVGRGIGLGIVIGGEIYRGAFGGAGEFGHTKTGSALQCECGATGCLEAVASDTAIEAQAAVILGRTVSVGEALDGARNGDRALHALFVRAGAALGEGIGNLLNLFNPELVIVTGEGTRAGDLLTGPMRVAVRDSAFGTLGDDTRVVVQEWGDEAWARGASSIVVHEMTRPPIYESGATGPLAAFLDGAMRRNGNGEVNGAR